MIIIQQPKALLYKDSVSKLCLKSTRERVGFKLSSERQEISKLTDRYQQQLKDLQSQIHKSKKKESVLEKQKQSKKKAIAILKATMLLKVGQTVTKDLNSSYVYHNGKAIAKIQGEIKEIVLQNQFPVIWVLWDTHHSVTPELSTNLKVINCGQQI